MIPARIRAIGQINTGTRADEDAQVVLMPPRKPGDVLMIYATGRAGTVPNNGRPEPEPDWEILYDEVTTSLYRVVYAVRVTANLSEITLRKGADQTVDAWMTQAWTLTGVTPNTPFYDEGISDLDSDGTIDGPIVVTGDDRMILTVFEGISFETYPGLVNTPAGFIGGNPQRRRASKGNFWRTAFFTHTADAGSVDTEVDYSVGSGGTTFESIFEWAIIGTDEVATPSLPEPFRLALDCAESYTVFITDLDYQTRIAGVGHSSLRWGRILDEVSPANVVIPDEYGGVACCIPYGQLRPWRFGMIIERNDIEVWKGPITGVTRQQPADTTGGTVTIEGLDVIARYQKRFATRTDIVDWKNTDAGVAFTDLINDHAHLDSDVWFTSAPEIFVGAAVTRRLLPRNFEKASDIITELAESAVDWFVMNGIIYAWDPVEGWRYFDGITRTLDGPYNSNMDFIYGLFTEEAFSIPPNWGMAGSSQTNFFVVPAAEQGEFGFRDYFSAESTASQLDVGVLDDSDPSPLDLPEDTPPADVATALQGRANTYIDQHAMVPITIEGGALAQGAPIDIPNLRPGSLWAMDLWDHCFGQLLTVARLKSVTVEVDYREGRISERISPTLYPPGFQGGEVT